MMHDDGEYGQRAQSVYKWNPSAGPTGLPHRYVLAARAAFMKELFAHLVHEHDACADRAER
jgi:hypothetical protein